MVRRRLASAALAVFLASWPVGATHVGLDDDQACGSPGLLSHSSTGIHNATPITPPQHCPLCHLQRATSGATADAPVAATVVMEAVDSLPLQDGRPASSTLADHKPSRAPPRTIFS